MTDVSTTELVEQLDRIEARQERLEQMLRRLLVAQAGRRKPRLPCRPESVDPEITADAIRAMTRGQGGE